MEKFSFEVENMICYNEGRISETIGVQTNESDKKDVSSWNPNISNVCVRDVIQ